MVEDARRVSSAEIFTAEDFMERLSPVDREAVHKITGLLGAIKSKYEEMGSPQGPAFWAVYGIGGRVTKPDEEPDDVDLMVVVQREPAESYLPPPTLTDRQRENLIEATDGEGVTLSIIDLFFKDYSLVIKDPVPKRYDMGASKKAVLRFLPRNEDGSRIDVVYVNGGFVPDGISCAFDFEQQVDVDEESRPLKRVLLAEYVSTGLPRRRVN